MKQILVVEEEKIFTSCIIKSSSDGKTRKKKRVHFGGDEEYKEENDIEEERHLVDTSIKENLEEYRDIVDQKDVIYNKKSIEKEEQKKLQKKIEG